MYKQIYVYTHTDIAKHTDISNNFKKIVTLWNSPIKKKEFFLYNLFYVRFIISIITDYNLF